MKLLTVKTWLPLFSGYYGTIWETDANEQNEIDWINEERERKGLQPIEWDDCRFDYKNYYEKLSKAVCEYVSDWFIENRYVHKAKYEKLSSPREYNFANDSIHVEYTLTKKNTSVIKKYLNSHKEPFSEYVKANYTSYDGFISHYSNDLRDWLDCDLADTHKLGAILNFIIINEDQLRETDVYEYLMGNGYNISVSNYIELVGC